MKKKIKTTKPGVVRKIIKYGNEPEKAEIAIPAADQLYREIRIENKLEDEEGKEAKLKPGTPVEVTIEAEKDQDKDQEKDKSSSDKGR